VKESSVIGVPASRPLLLQSDRLAARLREIPAEPGCYLMRDSEDAILYIGKAKVLRNRVRSYFQESSGHSPRISLMVRQICEIEFIVTDSEAEALALEANLIKNHQPHFNVLLKDDKKYPYLCITWSEPYPRIFITRRRRQRSPLDRFYGPYVDVGLLRRTLTLVKRVFPLRQRPQPLYRDRTCLNYDIGRCPGVCQQKISSEDYHQSLRKVAMVFQGRNDELLTLLQEQMQRCADRLDFESAAGLRDQLQGLDALTADQKMSLGDSSVSHDVVALAADDRLAAVQLFQMRAGRLVGRLGYTADAAADSGELADRGRILQRVIEDEQQLLATEDLAQLLELPVVPRRIEGFDISHIQGSDAVASQVVFIDGLPAKQHYRKYKIQSSSIRSGHSDDFMAMAEIMRRRFRRWAQAKAEGADLLALRRAANTTLHTGGLNDWPDVVMIDGGKGQLSAVMEALRELNLQEDLVVCSLAKQREEIFLPGASRPLDSEPEQLGVMLLRRLRDEAHRFAVSFHRQQRGERMRRSRLGDIPGLGPKRVKDLLAHFHSVDAIQLASPETLALAPGLGPALARQVWEWFHPQELGDDGADATPGASSLEAPVPPVTLEANP